MTTLAGDARVNPDLIRDDDENPGALSRGLAARIYLDGGRVEAGIPSQEIFRDQVFEFRGARGEPKLRQALTDTMRWSLEADVGPVVVEIIPVAGGPTKHLVFAANAVQPEVFVSNLPAQDVSIQTAHAHSMSADQMAVLHFGAYYKLLANDPVDLPLPSLSKGPARRGAALGGTTICPPAWFDQQ
jgi:hypothetical protein